MKCLPEFAEVQRIAATGQYDVLPVSCELLSDFTTPIETMKILKNVSTHCYLLESALANEKWGRYTFLGFDPKLEVKCIDGELRAGNFKIHTDNPSDYLRQILADYKSPRFDYLPSFTGGLVGYFSYDYLAYSEPSVKCPVEDSEAFQDVDLMLFDKVIAFDNVRQKIILIVNMSLDDVEVGYNKAVLELHQLAELLRHGEKKEEPGGKLLGEVTPLFDQAQFCAMVERAKVHIREGDIFQIVLSNRLSAPFEGSLLNTYRVLRTINPSPYMFYFSGTDVEVAGASPETLVKLENGILHTFPLAGTRPRGKTEAEDLALEQELLADEKELAEHNMLVDLGRNDLGKISHFGTVQVEKFHSIERYSHVMHIGSTVRGEIRPDLDALDAVEAVLPAGTLSGAPKIRACQLIGELENNKRGIYGGAIGYIDFTGNLDTCIAIRIAYKKNGKVFVRSGAGIVADSVPETEYQECINKAGASQSAGAGRGGDAMILLIDNYDSFSYNLYQLVGELEPDIRVIRNDEMTVEEIRKLHPDQIILSPGPGRPEDAGVTMEVVQDSGQGHPHLGRLPGTSGHLRRLRRYHHLRKAAHAREAVPGAVRCGLPLVSGLSGGSTGGPIPFFGGGQRHYPGLPEGHRPHHRRGGHGGAAQGVPYLRRAVPSGIHPDAGRKNHAAKFLHLRRFEP